MKNIRQQLSILTASALSFGASIAQAGGSNGSITFSPSAVSATAVPMLGGTLLILLSLLLVFIAFVAVRKRQNGVASVIAGALALASLASAGGGASLFHKAYAGIPGGVITDGAGDTFLIDWTTDNTYQNASGVPMTVGPVELNSCNAVLNSCDDGAELADGTSCQINCNPP